MIFQTGELQKSSSDTYCALYWHNLNWLDCYQIHKSNKQLGSTLIMKSKTKHETLSDVKNYIQKNNRHILGWNQFWGSILIFMLLRFHKISMMKEVYLENPDAYIFKCSFKKDFTSISNLINFLSRNKSSVYLLTSRIVGQIAIKKCLCLFVLVSRITNVWFVWKE